MDEKKLRRSRKGQIGGVCGGVASYFGVDATMVRLFWFITTFFWGTGLWIYLACWLIIPEAED